MTKARTVLHTNSVWILLISTHNGGGKNDDAWKQINIFQQCVPGCVIETESGRDAAQMIFSV